MGEKGPSTTDEATLVEEADTLLTALAEHHVREVPDARPQLEEALRLEASIPAIRAEASASRLTVEQAAARVRAIRAVVAAAQERSQDAEPLSAELLRRTAEAGSTAVAAMLAEERESLALAARALKVFFVLLVS